MTHSETFFANKEIVNNVHYKLIIRADDLANSMSTGMASKTKLALHNDCIIVSICWTEPEKWGNVEGLMKETATLQAQSSSP